LLMLEFRKPQRPEYIEAKIKALMLSGKLPKALVTVFPALFEPREWAMTQLQRAKPSQSAQPSEVRCKMK